MVTTFDSENGLLYVYVQGGPGENKVAQTDAEVDAAVNLDWDENGNLLGIEVLLGNVKPA